MKNWLIKLVALFLLLPFASLSLAAQVTYYDTNNVGTPVAMWDAGARKVWETEYYPFGKEYQTSTAIKNNDRKFVGKEKDKETDLTYFGARYYDDLSGRFLAPDPVRPVDALTSKTNHKVLDNPQRLNRYAYGLNNPYKYVDPDGKFPVPLVLACFAGAITNYLASPDVANAPADSSTPTSESHGGASIVAGAATVSGLNQIRLVGSAVGIGGNGSRSAEEAGIDPADARRIQNAANKTQQRITVVGSRAEGKAGPTSDWDYIMSGKSSSRHSAKSSVPRGTQGGEINSIGRESGIDVFQSYNKRSPNYSQLNKSKPHVNFNPKK